jgi:competence protein ComEC
MLLFAISCAWVAGIFLGSQSHFSPALILTGCLPLPFLFIYKKYRRSIVITAVCLAAFFGAAFYYPASLPEEDSPSIFNNQGVIELRGMISAPPDIRDKATHIEISLQEIKVSGSWQTAHGRVLVFTPRYPEYQYGDALSLRGELEKPAQFDHFDYQAYLEQKDIHSTMTYPRIEVIFRGKGSAPLEWIYHLRDQLSKSLLAALPEPQASLAQGIVLGIRSTIPDSLKENLSITGTAHLLAISGINLSIVAGILVILGLRLFGRRHYIYVWLALFLIWFYSLLTGMQSPVVRSAIMASIFLLAELVGRQKNCFAALAFSAAIMVGINPRILWNVSFQLSFLAMAGLVFIAPNLQTLGRKAVKSIFSDNNVGVIILTPAIDSFSVSLGAVLAVWPVIAYNFGLVSLIGPLSTFLIAPVLPFIIVLGAITALLGLVSSAAAQVAGWTAWLFLSYMLWLVNTLASAPMASVIVSAVHTSFIWIHYGILATAIWLPGNYKKARLTFYNFTNLLRRTITGLDGILSQASKKWTIPPLIVVAFLTSFAAVTMPDDNLHVSFLDVGEGDAILIQNGYRHILIDGGPSPQAVSLGLSNKIPFWNRNLDLVVLTHPHLDHLSGLIEVLSRYQVKQVLVPNLPSTSPAFQEWQTLIKTKGICLNLAQAGQQISLEKGAQLEILNPPAADLSETSPDLENDGVVARLIFNQVKFLFTADIGEEAEKRLIIQRAGLSCDVLKVSHHGSATSTSAEFISVVKPQIAVISVGAENRFGHPDSEVLARLQEMLIYRTDQSGSIEFITNGEYLRVQTEK